MRRSKMSINSTINNKARLNELQEKVIEWYHDNHRPLPWRKPIAPEGSLTSKYKALFERWKKIDSTHAHRDVSSSASALAQLHQTVSSVTPYGIWVSEIMSQQTRIDVVVPYWSRWMLKFPSIESLAEASSDEVRQYWQGLGFYRRVEFLHRGACAVAAGANGSDAGESGESSSINKKKKETKNKKGVFSSSSSLPSDFTALLKVPGVGPYTAAAIGSISFGVTEPVVDGNVLRVVARLFGIEQCNVKDKDRIVQITGYAKQMMKDLVDVGAGNRKKVDGVCIPGIWNQAIMEVGATICKPSGAPRCEVCPLAKWCVARRMAAVGDIEEIDGVVPLRSVALKKEVVRALVVVVSVMPPRHAAAGGEPKTVVFQRSSPSSSPPANTSSASCTSGRKLLSGFWSVPSVAVVPHSALDSFSKSSSSSRDDAESKITSSQLKKLVRRIFTNAKKTGGGSASAKTTASGGDKNNTKPGSSAATSFTIEPSIQLVLDALEDDDLLDVSLAQNFAKGKSHHVKHIFSHIDFSAVVCHVRLRGSNVVKSSRSGGGGTAKENGLSSFSHPLIDRYAASSSQIRFASPIELRDSTKVAISNLDEKVLSCVFPDGRRRRRQDEDDD